MWNMDHKNYHLINKDSACVISVEPSKHFCAFAVLSTAVFFFATVFKPMKWMDDAVANESWICSHLT